MKVVLALVLNAALLAWLLPWLRRQWQTSPRRLRRLRRLLLPMLTLRLLLGGYGAMHLRKDARTMNKLGHALTMQVWEDPAGALESFRGNKFTIYNWHMKRKSYSAGFFVAKLLVGANLASGELNWLNGAYVALFGFLGSWMLVRTLAEVWPAAPIGASVVALLLWPSVLIFATGISKETLLLGSGTWLVALVLRGLYDRPAPLAAPRRRHVLPGVLSLGLIALIHLKMRYFFALPLLGVLTGLAVIRLAQRLGLANSRLSQAALLLAVLAAGTWLGPALNPVLSTNRFTTELIKIYNNHLSTSAQKPHFEYPSLRPTVESAAQHAPLAVWNTLTRPWLGESWALPYVVASLENLALLALLAVAAWATVRGRAGRLPFALVLALGVYCLLLAGLIGLSTPNLGSLHRYRSVMTPFLLLLLLQNDYAAGLLRRIGLGNAPRPPAPGPTRAVSLPA